MPRVNSRFLFLAFGAVPFLVAFSQQPPAPQQGPTAEQVYKNIQVFKGQPATDLIPAMEFMSASLHWECTDCHDPKDYTVDTRAKETARKMILMQRDINAKNFNNRNEVTCMSCHRGDEHPMGTPTPVGISLRHARMTSAPKPDELFSKYVAAVGVQNAAIVRVGTLTAPNDETHKVETKPLEFIQAPGGKFRMVAGERKVGSDGTQTWYGSYPMTDEPALIFNRIGGAWRTQDAFASLERAAVAGTDTVGKTPVVVVRGSKPAAMATQEFSFDAKTGMLVRVLNARRSSLGTVLSAVDFSNYKTVGGVKVPMKVVATFAGGEQWIMDFKSAKVDPSVSDAIFKMGS